MKIRENLWNFDFDLNYVMNWNSKRINILKSVVIWKLFKLQESWIVEYQTKHYKILTLIAKTNRIKSKVVFDINSYTRYTSMFITS